MQEAPVEQSEEAMEEEAGGSLESRPSLLDSGSKTLTQETFDLDESEAASETESSGTSQVEDAPEEGDREPETSKPIDE